MKPDDPLREDALNPLLARRYRDTSPEFEARWIALKRDLRQAPASRRPAARLWFAWLALGTTAAAAALLVLFLRPAADDPAPALSPALADLFTMDAVLSRGTALLDGENRDALLHLPVPSHPRS